MNPFVARCLNDVPFLTNGAFMLRAGLDPQAAEHPAIKRMRDGLKPRIEQVGNLAVVPIVGALMRRPDPWEQAFGDAEDTDALADLVREAAGNSEFEGILLDVDSPGGFYGGGPELADAVRSATKAKPVVAYTGGLMASLAYWVGSQATEVIASRSAAVGSVGVYIAVYDYTKLFEAYGIKVEVFKNAEGTLKAAGLPGTSLTDDHRAHLQERAQTGFSEFSKAVRAARGDVPADAMKGQTFNGPEAKRMGLVDRVGDRSYAFSVLRRTVMERRRG